MVRIRGVEPPHPYGYMNLNHARLPVPPYPHVETSSQKVSQSATFARILEQMPTKPLEPESSSRHLLDAFGPVSAQNFEGQNDSCDQSDGANCTKVSHVFELPLSAGKVALIDAEDEAIVKARGKWSAHWTGYAWYAMCGRGGKWEYLHRFLMGAAKGQFVDHRNRQTLDCRRSNLRFATPSQQSANRGKRANTSSRYIGVDLHLGKWRAKIKKDGAMLTLGHFSEEEDAARARDEAALELYGDFAVLNLPRVSGVAPREVSL